MNFPKGRRYDIIPVGRIAVDFNPVDYNRPLEQSETFKKYLGGSPANIAVGMARLGRSCGFLARVSDDQMGRFVTDFFIKEGIDVSHVRKCVNGESIGLTFTEILSPEKSSILMYREHPADLSLEPADADEEYIASAGTILISGSALSASPSREAALKALALARKNGLKIVFDADFRPYNWKSEDETAVYCALAAEKSDIILGSREEFDKMERLIGLDGRDETSADYWLSRGAELLVVKHGREGSRAYARNESYRVRPFPVDALKGFGGGDGYASALLTGLMEGRSLKDALEMGSASAAMLVASHACSKDMPTMEALTQFIKEKKKTCGEVVERMEM